MKIVLISDKNITNSYKILLNRIKKTINTDKKYN